MRLLIGAIAALTVATKSGCGVSGPGETAGLEQAIVQTCAVAADCSPFADQCLATQIAACAQAGTASAHCVCVTPPAPSNPSHPPAGPGPSCWQIRNDCVAACSPDEWSCRNACDAQWGSCGF